MEVTEQAFKTELASPELTEHAALETKLTTAEKKMAPVGSSTCAADVEPASPPTTSAAAAESPTSKSLVLSQGDRVHYWSHEHMHVQTCVVTLITKEEDGSIKVVMDNGHVMSTSTQATENGVRICLLSKTDTAQSSQIPITDFALVISTVPTTIQRGLHSLEEHGRNSNGGRCYDAYYKNIKLY